jgi:hypothetical protein
MYYYGIFFDDDFFSELVQVVKSKLNTKFIILKFIRQFFGQ